MDSQDQDSGDIVVWNLLEWKFENFLSDEQKLLVKKLEKERNSWNCGEWFRTYSVCEMSENSVKLRMAGWIR